MDANDAKDLTNEITKGSALKQIALGASIGLCTGVVLGRVGQVGASAIGGTLIFVAVANNQGWIKINWSVADKVVEKVRKEADQLKGKKAQVKSFVKKNVCLVVGFLGGFSIGLVV